MRYSEFDQQKREEFDSYFLKQAADQSGLGRDVFDQVNKAVLLANTGGIAICASILDSDNLNSGVLTIAMVFFVVGVLAFVFVRFWLAVSLGKSVAALKQFHLEAIQDKQDVSGDAVRDQLAKITQKLDGANPIWALTLPIVLFSAGAFVGLISLFWNEPPTDLTLP